MGLFVDREDSVIITCCFYWIIAQRGAEVTSASLLSAIARNSPQPSEVID